MKVTLVNSDDGDWQGIYVNGVLQAEDHSLDASQILESLGIEFRRRTVRMDPYEFNRLPEAEEELPND